MVTRWDQAHMACHSPCAQCVPAEEVVRLSPALLQALRSPEGARSPIPALSKVLVKDGHRLHPGILLDMAVPTINGGRNNTAEWLAHRTRTATACHCLLLGEASFSCLQVAV